MSINKGTTTYALLVMVLFMFSMNTWCEYGEATRIFLDFSTSTQGVTRLPFPHYSLLEIKLHILNLSVIPYQNFFAWVIKCIMHMTFFKYIWYVDFVMAVMQRQDGLGTSHRRSTRAAPRGGYPSPAANVNDHVHH